MHGDHLQPLPELFVKRFQQIVPLDYINRGLATFAKRKPTAFRINTLQADIPETVANLEALGFTLTAVPWLPGTYWVEATARRALTETAVMQARHIYIQNLSSMVAPVVLAPQPGEIILDLAAAPGSKTSQMAVMMENQGQISAVEVVKKRFFRLRSNLAEQGVTIAKTYLKDGRMVGRQCPDMFDRVLLDAPCSSEARFRQYQAQSWAHWRLRKVKEVAHKQKGLLHSAFTSLKPGGRLLYCTCSFAPEENEAVVHNLLQKWGEAAHVEPISLPLTHVQSGLTHWQGRDFHPDVALAVRILPTTLMDGFFLCQLTKSL